MYFSVLLKIDWRGYKDKLLQIQAPADRLFFLDCSGKAGFYFLIQPGIVSRFSLLICLSNHSVISEPVASFPT
jgi:hypothetical protein